MSPLTLFWLCAVRAEDATMDESLLRQAQAMKARAMSNAGSLAGSGASGSKSASSATAKPVKKVVKPKGSLKRPAMPVPTLTVDPSTGAIPSIRNFSSMPSSFRTKNKFGILKIIIDHMRGRHKDKVHVPLTFDEILREIKYTDMSPNMRDFLQNALRQNPKISVKEEDKFLYKPQYDLEGKRQLIDLLKRRDEEGLGATKLSDILESMPSWEKQRVLDLKQVMSFTRPDKETIVFYSNTNYQLPIPDEFRQLWRGVSVEGLSDADVESFLKKAGITTMQETGKRKLPSTATKSKKKRARQSQFLNQHLDGSLLIDYSNETPESK